MESLLDENNDYDALSNDPKSMMDLVSKTSVCNLVNLQKRNTVHTGFLNIDKQSCGKDFGRWPGVETSQPTSHMTNNDT